MSNKKNVIVASTKTIEQSSILIGSIKVSIRTSDEPIDIEDQAQSTMQKVGIGAATSVNESENNKPKSK